MNKRTKFIIAVCLVAQSFTSFVLSFVYAGKKKELSKTFLGLGILGGLGSAYLLYNDYLENKAERLAYDDDCCCDDCCDDDFFDDEDSADDINFTIAEEEPAEEDEEKGE